MSVTTSNIEISMETTLDVTGKYSELITAMTGEDSLYIKAKETLEELFKNNTMTAVDKSNIISSTISNITIQSTVAALNTALQWSSAEKELFLNKTKLSYELEQIQQTSDNLAQEKLNKEQANLQLQAEMIRMYGIPTLVNGKVTALDNTGKLYNDTKLVIQQTANELTKNTQISAQTEELYARIHQLVADTYINHGIFTGYTVEATGITGLTRTNFTGVTTLSDINASVGKQQAKGYIYNAWANAVSSSASMLSTLISTESNVDYTPYLNKWNTAITNLNSLVVPNDL